MKIFLNPASGPRSRRFPRWLAAARLSLVPAAAVVVLFTGSAIALQAQSDVAPGQKQKPADGPRIVIKPLLKTSLSGDPGREVVIALGEFPPGATTGRHTHPGDEYATVLEGELEILVDGQPPKRVMAGEAYHNARDVVHETRNVGDRTARVVSTFVIDKGRPVMVPVPAH